MATDDRDTLQDEIAHRTAKGWLLVWRGVSDAQMRRPKRFSFWWFLFWTIFSLGFLFWLYPAWHWARRDELIFLRLKDGQLTITGERRGFWRTLFAPLVTYWRWAGRRKAPLSKALAYGGPLVAIIVTLVIVGALAGGGEEQEATTGPPQEPTPAAALELRNEARLAVGAVAEAEGVQITINAILDPCDCGFPDPGMRTVAFHLTVENVSDSRAYVYPWEFKLTDHDRFQYELALFSAPEPWLDYQDLRSGTKTKGSIAFEVREGAPLEELYYDPDPFTTKDIHFRAQEGDAVPSPTQRQEGSAVPPPAETNAGYQLLGSAGPDTYRLLIDGREIEVTVNSMVNSHIRQTVDLTVQGQPVAHLPAADFSQFVGLEGTSSDYMSGEVEVLFQQDVKVGITYPVFLQQDPMCCPTGGTVREMWRVTPEGFELLSREELPE